MNRVKLISVSFAALLSITGCKTSTTNPQPAPVTTPTNTSPTNTSANKTDQNHAKPDPKIKPRKGSSTDLDKTDAYRKYVP